MKNPGNATRSVGREEKTYLSAGVPQQTRNLSTPGIFISEYRAPPHNKIHTQGRVWGLGESGGGAEIVLGGGGGVIGVTGGGGFKF